MLLAALVFAAALCGGAATASQGGARALRSKAAREPLAGQAHLTFSRLAVDSAGLFHDMAKRAVSRQLSHGAGPGASNATSPGQTYLCEWRHESHTVACVLEKHPRLVTVEETIPLGPKPSCRREPPADANATAPHAAASRSASEGDLVVREGPHRRAMLHFLCSEKLPAEARTGSELRNDTAPRAPAGSDNPEAPFHGSAKLRPYVTGPAASATAGEAGSAVSTDAEHSALNGPVSHSAAALASSNVSAALEAVHRGRLGLRSRMYDFWSVMQESRSVSEGRLAHSRSVLVEASRYTLAAIPIAGGPSGIVSAGPLVDGAAIAAAQAENAAAGGPLVHGVYPGSLSEAAKAAGSQPGMATEDLPAGVLAMPYRDLGPQLPILVEESPVLRPVVAAVKRSLAAVTPPHTASAAAEAVTMTLLARRLRATAAELFSVYPPALSSTAALREFSQPVEDDSSPLPHHFDRSGIDRSPGPIVAARTRQLARDVTHLRRLASLAAARAGTVSNTDPRAVWRAVEAVIRRRLALGETPAAAATSALGADAAASLERREEDAQEEDWLASVAEAGGQETAATVRAGEAARASGEAAPGASGPDPELDARDEALLQVLADEAGPAAARSASSPQHLAAVSRIASEAHSTSASGAVAEAAVRDFDVLHGERALDAAAALGEWRRAGRAVHNLGNLGWSRSVGKGAAPVKLSLPGPPKAPQEEAAPKPPAASAAVPTPKPKPVVAEGASPLDADGSVVPDAAPEDSPFAADSLLQTAVAEAEGALRHALASGALDQSAADAAPEGTASLLQAWASAIRRSGHEALAAAVEADADAAASDEALLAATVAKRAAGPGSAHPNTVNEEDDADMDPRERLLANAASFRFQRHGARDAPGLAAEALGGAAAAHQAQPQDSMTAVDAVMAAVTAAEASERAPGPANVADEEAGGPLVRRMPADIAAAARSAGRRVASLLVRLNGTLACLCLHAGTPVAGLALPPQPPASLTDASAASGLVASLGLSADPGAGEAEDDAEVARIEDEEAAGRAVAAVDEALNSKAAADAAQGVAPKSILPALLQASGASRRLRGGFAPPPPAFGEHARPLYARSHDGPPSHYLAEAHGEGDGVVLPSDRRGRMMDDLSAFFTALERFTPRVSREAGAAFAGPDLLRAGTTGRSDPRAAMPHSKESQRPLGSLPLGLARSLLVYVARERERQARWPAAPLDMHQARVLADVAQQRLGHALGKAAMAGGAGDQARPGQAPAHPAPKAAAASAHPAGKAAPSHAAPAVAGAAPAASLLELEASAARAISSVGRAAASRRRVESQAAAQAAARRRALATVVRTLRAPGAGAPMKAMPTAEQLPSEAALDELLPADLIGDTVMFSGGLAQLTPTRLGLPPSNPVDAGRWVAARMQEWQRAFDAEKEDVTGALAALNGEAPWKRSSQERSKADAAAGLHRHPKNSWPVLGINASVVSGQLRKLGAQHGMLHSELDRMSGLLSDRMQTLKDLLRKGIARAEAAASALGSALDTAAQQRQAALDSAKTSAQGVSGMLGELKGAIDSVAAGTLATGARPEDIAACLAEVSSDEAARGEGNSMAESASEALQVLAAARRELAAALEAHPSKKKKHSHDHKPPQEDSALPKSPAEQKLAKTAELLSGRGVISEDEHPVVLQGLATGGTDGMYTIFPPDDVQFRGVKVYCDMTTDGGGWTLVAYGQEGQVGGPMGVSHGMYDPVNRSASAGLNALWVAQASKEVALSWMPKGADAKAPPSGPMHTYGAAAAYAVPIPATTDLALTPAPPPQTCVSDRGDYTVTTVRCLAMPKKADAAEQARRENQRQAEAAQAAESGAAPAEANDALGFGGDAGNGVDSSDRKAVDGSGATLPPPQGTQTEHCKLPARMYTGTQSLGVCHGHAYGVVLRGAPDQDCDGPLALGEGGSKSQPLVPGAPADAPRQGPAQLGLMVGVDGTPGCAGVMDQGRDGFVPRYVAVWMR
ncbi:hypothetical protein FNF28_01048 [Cafeteria roenbergensis]|uniref:Fibrinogen C-terminal domain-containing protein n=1 Tax=Cafeteria roenbergensis TaxID=33653 RepID=A0A5A8DZS0_CAFRO|nr:hypothetical protein FNF28_01048 [Cafeteria roenbergensis]